MNVNKIAARITKQLLSAVTEPIFDYADADKIIKKVKSGIKAPVVTAQMPALGGEERASLLIMVALDPKSTWPNNILENSRYFRIDIERNGSMEQFTMSRLSKKMRKTKVKSIDDAIKKINKYIGEVKE